MGNIETYDDYVNFELLRHGCDQIFNLLSDAISNEEILAPGGMNYLLINIINFYFPLSYLLYITYMTHPF